LGVIGADGFYSLDASPATQPFASSGKALKAAPTKQCRPMLIDQSSSDGTYAAAFMLSLWQLLQI